MQKTESTTKTDKTQMQEPTFWETSALSAGHSVRNPPKSQKRWETMTQTQGTSLPSFWFVWLLCFLFFFVFLVFWGGFGETVTWKRNQTKLPPQTPNKNNRH